MTDLKNIVMTKAQMAGLIDKTGILKEHLERVPSIYIEGAASSGKTTAVRMLVSGQEAFTCFWYDFSVKMKDHADQVLKEAAAGDFDIIVIDRLDLCGDKAFIKNLESLIRRVERKKIILISREKPDENLVRLLWEDKMRIIPQEYLSFTLDDIRDLGRQRGVFVNPGEFMEETGGWPGCVSLCMNMVADLQNFIREKSDEPGSESISRAHPVRSRILHRIMHRYEIESFIEKEIMGGLSEDGQRIMQCAVSCPWISEDMCERCLGIEGSGELLEDLRRQGVLCRTGDGRYRAMKLFKARKTKFRQPWKTYSSWFEEHGHFKEAYTCLCRYVFGTQKEVLSPDTDNDAEDGKKAVLDTFLFAHYDRIPFFGEDYSFVLEDERNDYPMIYLRGMCRYQRQDFERFQSELRSASRLKGYEGQEVYLNLLYADVRISAREFMDHCRKTISSGKGKKYRLFSVIGHPFISLCGLRDLSSLFACKKREEDRYAEIWQSTYGSPESRIYSMARLDYYMETNRTSQVQEEIGNILSAEAFRSEDSVQMQLYMLLLLCKLQKKNRGEDFSERIFQIRELLHESGDNMASELSEAVFSIYGSGQNRLDLVDSWVRSQEGRITEKLNESNCYLIFALTKGQVLLGRYEKAAGPASRLAVYLSAFRRHKLLSEVLFIQAVIRFHMGEKGTALRNTIESFSEGGAFRYVRFYTDYGNTGKQVLDQFIEWHEAQNPEKWKRKRKYDYRSVLNMPESEYLYTVARAAGREDNTLRKKQIPETERLTVTEMVVIQSLSRGLTNEQIAGELNLKVTTVKSHLYSIYKKLGVKSRMEAVVRAGEMQLLYQ